MLSCMNCAVNWKFFSFMHRYSAVHDVKIGKVCEQSRPAAETSGESKDWISATHREMAQTSDVREAADCHKERALNAAFRCHVAHRLLS